jgi:hypothetical protein
MTATVKVMTRDELREYVTRQYDEQSPEVMMKIYAWLRRGDGAAVYENQDLGHPDLGSCKIVSFGSPAAQLETLTPPEILPDIEGAINWRYILVATHRLPT